MKGLKELVSVDFSAVMRKRNFRISAYNMKLHRYFQGKKSQSKDIFLNLEVMCFLLLLSFSFII